METANVKLQTDNDDLTEQLRVMKEADDDN